MRQTTTLYQPIGTWTGRLILPLPEQRQPDDSVLIEIHNAAPDDRHWLGRTVPLCWSHDPGVQSLVQAVSRDVEFNRFTWLSEKQGNLHPTRLNGWKRVGPLESLAGAREQDDVVVWLRDAVTGRDRLGRPCLVIQTQPVQITGRLVGLATLVKREAEGSDRFWVNHFNPNSKQFDGLIDIVRIPQVDPDRNGVYRSTTQGMEHSPLNPQGWYLYGEYDAEGVFEVQAIEPRALMLLKPDIIRLGYEAAITYIHHENWQHIAMSKGTASTALVSAVDDATHLDLAPQDYEGTVGERHSQTVGIRNPEDCWHEGETAIVVHLYGGIGGKKAEPSPFGLVPGHFSYGIARVVRDRLSTELRFELEYRQIYGHNPDGIVAGAIAWSSYMGDLRRGWMGDRPISDVLIKLPTVTQPYDFDGTQLSPITEFIRQLDGMTARYRIGHGSGVALINLATSCVQDSNQALYITIKRLQTFARVHPEIRLWLRAHPDHPQTRRFQRLIVLGRRLERNLVPFGIARPDWRKNVVEMIKTRNIQNLIDMLLRAILTWRTMMPRRAHDDILVGALKNGAVLWFIRTNQVGGNDPEIQPRAPKALLGHWNQ